MRKLTWKLETRISALWVFLVLAAVGSVLSSSALAGEDSILRADLEKHMTFLASDALKGRDSGSEGLREAAAYISRHFQELGLKPMGDPAARSFFQKVSMQGELRAAADQNLLSGSGRAWALHGEFMPFAFSSNGELHEREVVFAGYGVANPETKYDDYAGLDVAGKIVVVLRYEHADAGNADGSPTQHAYLTTKAKLAAQHGAAGLIIVNGPHGKAMEEGDPLFGLRSAGRMSGKKIPAIHAKRSFLEALLKETGRSLSELQTALDRDYQPISFVIPDVRVSMSVHLEKSVIEADNVIALLEGSDPDLKDEVVVIGAHYDHVGMGHFGSRWGSEGYDQIHNGADDNASGTAVVMEVAQAFARLEQRPKRGMLFILFCGEERGLLGSQFFTERPTIPLANQIAMINADMVGRAKDGGVSISGVGTSPGFTELVEGMGLGLDLKIETNESGIAPSDNTSFYKKDIPVLFYFTGIHDQYHTPDDDVHRINFEAQTEIGKHLFRVARKLGDAPDRPVFQKTEPGSRGVRLGIYTKDLDAGLGVESVASGSPAESAGLKSGDIIVTFDGKSIRSVTELRSMTAKLKPGSQAQVGFLRPIEDQTASKMEATLQF